MIIGLLGPAGVGKTTIAKYLEKRYGFQRRSLATPLKEIARLALDFSHDQVYGTQEQKEAIDPRYGFSPRWFLQRLGTEGVRTVLGADFWVDYLCDAAWGDVVVDDVRFINEATRISQIGEVWRVECTDRNVFGTHVSESEWSRAPYDARITAPYGATHELEAQAHLLIEDLK
jgi:hypothetical protein